MNKAKLGLKCLNEHLETQKFDCLRNTNLIKFEILEISVPKLGKLLSKLKFKHEKFIFFEFDKCLNSKFSSSMELEFDEM